MVPPSPASLAVFLAVVAFAGGLPVAGILAGTPAAARPATLRRVLGLLLGWLALSSLVALAGWARGPAGFPVAAGLLVLNLALAVALGFSRWGDALLRLPIAWLVGFHVFRLPLEAVLHAWAEGGTVPADISWGGENFDVLTALLAPVVAWVAHRSRAAVVVFELLGVAMLANIVRIVIRSTPGSPLFSGVEPPVQLAAHWPTVWIATVCVFAAVAGHVVIARWLLQSRGEALAAPLGPRPVPGTSPRDPQPSR